MFNYDRVKRVFVELQASVPNMSLHFGDENPHVRHCPKMGHMIFLNENEHPYEVLLTLLHEVSHVILCQRGMSPLQMWDATWRHVLLEEVLAWKGAVSLLPVLGIERRKGVREYIKKHLLTYPEDRRQLQMAVIWSQAIDFLKDGFVTGKHIEYAGDNIWIASRPSEEDIPEMENKDFDQIIEALLWIVEHC